VQRAHRARIVIVSPSLLMLSIQVVTSLLRDQRMKEQAHLIQEEVGKMMDDVGRLDERVKKLQLHFGHVNKDIDDILISTRRVTARGGRIAQVEFNGAGGAGGAGAEGQNGADRDGARAAQRAVPRSVPRPRNGPPELPFNGFEEIRDDR
jgi:DNA recombination protein RmuC